VSENPYFATRIIVCGSRDWTDRATLDATLDRLVGSRLADEGGYATIVHGHCPFGGADKMAEEWVVAARSKWRWDVRCERHPAETRGTAGFHKRNQDMADLGAWRCVGFTDGRDPKRGTWGTGDMFSRALRAGIPIIGVPSRRDRA